jgi:hypothetical protein
MASRQEERITVKESHLSSQLPKLRRMIREEDREDERETE